MFETSHSFVFFTFLSAAALLFALSSLVVTLVMRARRHPRRRAQLPVVKLDPPKRRRAKGHRPNRRL